MKFRLSFSVHSDLFTTGSRKILTLPGLVEFGVYNSMLYVSMLYEYPIRTMYIAETHIVHGFNKIILDGNGVVIYLNVNGTIFKLLDTTDTMDVLDYNINGTITIVDEYLISNFNSHTTNYIYAKEFPNIQTATKWRIGARLDFKGYGTGYYPIFGSSAPFEQRYRYPNLLVDGSSDSIYALISSDGTSLGDFYGGHYPGLQYVKGVMTDVVLEYDNGTYRFGMKSPKENTYTYGTDVVSSPAYYTTDGQFQFGCVWGDRYAGNTTFDVRGCFIEADGVKYSNIKIPYKQYPKLDIGQLNIYANSWTVLKDIEALKLEN